MKTKVAIGFSAALALLFCSCLGKPQVPSGPSAAPVVKPPASPAKPTSHPYAFYGKLSGLVDGTDKTPFLLLDVRTKTEYDEGHIPGALLLPFDEIGPGEPDVSKDRLIVVYCRSGRRSATAAETLKGLGFTEIADFGGVSNWLGELEK